MSLAVFLRKVAEILDEAGVPYMLTGSLASAYYAVPRATQDLDVVIAAEEPGIERVVQDLLKAQWYVGREAALEARRTQGQFTAIDPESGWKVDLIVRRDRTYSRTEFERRERVALLGVEVAVASLEDFVIAKLEWGRLGDSALQRRDVVQLLERAWDQLDQAYLKEWITDLGLQSEWDEARRQVERRGLGSGRTASRPASIPGAAQPWVGMLLPQHNAEALGGDITCRWARSDFPPRNKRCDRG